jgi:predicted DCC family thiol-disulfide oxidoreductase YuxK
VNSEIAKLSDATPDWPRGWVLYDGDCSLCRQWVVRFERTLTVRGFDLAPLQSAWVTECLDLPEHELLSRMRVLTPDGRDYAGADALIHLARHVWWAWPFWILAHLPLAKAVLRLAYDFLARHRHCDRGSCIYAAPVKTPSDPDRRVV